ncbi:MAG: hypothetical protein KAU14_01965 [Thermoplasmata archaeon]|nr:hypothetical protein [Thermoplasmata archaeon]
MDIKSERTYHEVEALKEQLLMFESIEKKGTRKRVSKEEYRKYLRKTEKAQKASIGPTNYIRETRTKGDFY